MIFNFIIALFSTLFFISAVIVHPGEIIKDIAPTNYQKRLEGSMFRIIVAIGLFLLLSYRLWG